MERLSLLTLSILTLISGCGGSEIAPQAADAPARHTPKPQAAGAHDRLPTAPEPTAEPAAPQATPEPASRGLPTDCIRQGDLCVPPSDFVDRLCERSHPDVAVYMMGPEQPWTHRYVLVEEAQAINPVNGRIGEVKLTFGEEVLILRFRAPSGRSGIEVSGTEHYEVLRWDGSCATLEPGEFVEDVPARQRRFVAPTWKRIGDAYKELLLKEANVADAELRRRADCKGVGLGRLPKCYVAMEALNGAIAEAIKGGVKLPLPEILP